MVEEGCEKMSEYKIKTIKVEAGKTLNLSEGNIPMKVETGWEIGDHWVTYLEKVKK